MFICIHCRLPLSTLYTTYSRADDSSLGKGVRLTQCPRCKRFADKYVEHDFVVLFIDLVLIKPQVYRHLLFNRLGGAGSGGDGGGKRREKRKRWGMGGDWDPSILRLGILLLLFDVYLTWARIEKLSPSPTTSPTSLTLPPAPLTGEPINATDALASLTSSPTSSPSRGGFLASQSILNQYLFFLLLCTLETVVFHGLVRFICTRPWFADTGRAKLQQERDLNYNYNYNSRGRDGMNTPWAGSRAPSRNVSRRPSMEDMELRRTSTGKGGTLSVPSSPVIPSSVPAMATGTSSTSLPAPALPQPNATIATSPITLQVPSPTTLSTALLVSSLPNLFPLLMVIWAYDLPSSASAVSWAVIVNNIAALEILLDCGVLRAAGVVGVAGIGRWCVGRAVLGAVGLGGVGGEFGVENLVAGLRALVGV